MHVLHIVGARPNFMKAAPVMRAMAQRGAKQTLVHTGQHYGANMSEIFFSQLQMPAADVNLGVGSGSHARQTAEIMTRLESVVLEKKPDVVAVYGDVNSTLAGALVCAKLLVPIAHIEAGLRSFDRTMPEEINRIVTDRLSNWLFTPSEDAGVNLQREGVAADKIFFVGNVMIDSLVRLLPIAAKTDPAISAGRYALVTLHRPSNVDCAEVLAGIVEALLQLSEQLTVIFPVHPRTRQRISALGTDLGRLHLLEPLPYVEFLALEQGAAVVITDSGGVQEETTYLRVPCLTLRANTERPVTVTRGTNVLVGNDRKKLHVEVGKILDGNLKAGEVPPLWDGHAAERIAAVLCK